MNLVDILRAQGDLAIVESLRSEELGMGEKDYRRAVGTDVWHWNPNCVKWPTKAYGCTQTEPSAGTKCKECGSP